MPNIRRLLDVQPGESQLLALASATVCSVVALNVVTIGATTALVLGEHSPSVLPPLYSVGAVVSILTTLGMSSTVGRYGRWTETVGGLLILAASLAVAWGLLAFETRWTVLVLHPWGLVLSSLFVVQTFALINDKFDSGQVRRLLPLVGAGGSIGAIAGGTGLFQLAGVMGVRNLLLASVSLAMLAGLGAHALVCWRVESAATASAALPPPQQLDSATLHLETAAGRPLARALGLARSRGWHRFDGVPFRIRGRAQATL